jgi:cell division septal protein FtsQ
MYKSKYKKISSRNTQRRRSRKTFKIIGSISIVIFVLAGLVYLLRADFLMVRDFEISGAESIEPEEIKNVALSFASGSSFYLIPRSNIIFLDGEKLASAILSEFSRMEKVEIKKKFFIKKVELAIAERKEDYVWCSGEEVCFFMTKEGFVFERIPENPADKIIFRGNLEGDPTKTYFDSPEQMKKYIKFIEILEKSGFRVHSVEIESKEKGVANTLMADIIFNPRESDLSVSAQNIILLVDDLKSKNSSVRFDYIDSRFGNKIFYKLAQ